MKSTKTIFNKEYQALVATLIDARTRLGLSQAEVAKFLNMQQSDISKIENLERRLDVLEFKKLISIYRVATNPTLNLKIRQLLGLHDDN